MSRHTRVIDNITLFTKYDVNDLKLLISLYSIPNIQLIILIKATRYLHNETFIKATSQTKKPQKFSKKDKTSFNILTKNLAMLLSVL